ncbi:MAG: DNA-binding response regulator, partial [Thermoleophilia bacterium]|nr:DNA-binding response regulator [Thermoleophilia bacterium]
MTKVPTRCLIADDHPMMLEIVRLHVEAVGFEVVAEATNGEQAVQLAVEFVPDIAVIDISMPQLDGIAVLRRFAEAGLPTRSLVLTARGTTMTIDRAMGAGAYGFIGKNSTGAVIAEALRAVAAGGRYLDPLLAGSTYGSAHASFSRLEMRVLQNLVAGMTNRQIA